MRKTSAGFVKSSVSEPTLQEILVALSFALDLTEDAVPGHAIRSCLLAVRLGLYVGLDSIQTCHLYYATLLKDVGCSSNSARMCQIVGGDDRVVKAGAKLTDWTRPLRPQLAAAKLLWKQVLPSASLLKRTARILHIAAHQLNTSRELIELRCDRGAQIVRKLGLGDEVAFGVRHLDEHWDGGGYPMSLKGNEIPIISSLMGVSQHLDAFCMDRGPQVAIDTLVERSGRWFDPELCRAAVELHRAGNLWSHCLPADPIQDAQSAVLRLFVDTQSPLSAIDIDSICEAFADVVDAKSPFTYRHSLGVRDAAVAIGNVLGLPEHRMSVLRRSALLHDLGKLGVSNTILDKPGKLTDAEFAVVKGHPTMSAEILNHVDCFREISLIAGEHHEKIDGTGYPYGLTGDALSFESKILAVADIFGALSEDRPYRGPLAPDQIRAIMDRDVPKKLDATSYEALRVVMDRGLLPQKLMPSDSRDPCTIPMGRVLAEAAG